MTHIKPKALSRQQVLDARLYANRRDLITALLLDPLPTVAEVGVAFGDFSAFIIQTLSPKQFYAFDLFDLHNVPYLWGTPSSETFQGKTHYEYYRSKLKHFDHECEVVIEVGDSSSNLLKQTPGTFDLIYIDGNHTYDGVRKDADAAIRAIKPDGILVFNDYIIYDHFDGVDFGVVQVVNELCTEDGWCIIGMGLHEEMFCDVAITRGLSHY